MPSCTLSPKQKKGLSQKAYLIVNGTLIACEEYNPNMGLDSPLRFVPFRMTPFETASSYIIYILFL